MAASVGAWMTTAAPLLPTVFPMRPSTACEAAEAAGRGRCVAADRVILSSLLWHWGLFVLATMALRRCRFYRDFSTGMKA